MCSSECLDSWSGGGCGVFIAPNHQFNRWGRLLSMGAPDTVIKHVDGCGTLNDKMALSQVPQLTTSNGK
jgi:hypothetical protein